MRPAISGKRESQRLLWEGSGAAEGGCQITATSWVCLREEQLGACPAPFPRSAALGNRLQLSEPVREE